MIGYLKLGGAIIGGLALAGFLWWCKSKLDDAARVPFLEQERDELLYALDRKDQDIANVQEASLGYQAELSDLRNFVSTRPARVVRVCDAPRVSEPGPLPPTGAGPNGGTARTGPASTRPGPDIGPDLYAIADSADRLSAQVRGLQEYARSCSGAPASDSGVTAIDGHPIVDPDLSSPGEPDPWSGLNVQQKQVATAEDALGSPLRRQGPVR